MWHTVPSHQLVKLNYRCRIHCESFITSHCPPWSPTASSLFSCGALLEICPINVIAGDSLSQSSDSLKTTATINGHCSHLPAVKEKDYSDKLQEERFFSFVFLGNLSNYSCLGIMDLLPCVLSNVNSPHCLSSHT